MKICSFLIISFLIISLAGCAAPQESGKVPGEIPESQQNSGSPEDQSSGQSDEKPEGLDWTISVDDAISGKYELPAGGKALEYTITLILAAWKSGGEDVYGRYEGEAYILFEFDESGLSDSDYLYMGGGAFNRRCEKLEFEVEVYDQEKLNRQTIPLPDKVSVVPLRNFNAMASFESVWSTILQIDETVKGRKSGETFSDIKGEFDEGTSDNMGLCLLIDNGHVTVDIPTYRLTWNCGYFNGTVTSSPLGTAKRERLDVPDAGIINPDAADDGKKEKPTKTDKYINKDPNGLSGYDMNGDGKVDAYIDDDGNLKFDLNFDGVFDDLEDTGEDEWGQG